LTQTERPAEKPRQPAIDPAEMQPKDPKKATTVNSVVTELSIAETKQGKRA
jgi:hypothetical protein